MATARRFGGKMRPRMDSPDPASLRLELFVPDVAPATDFFISVLGFEKLESGQAEYVVLVLGNVRIALAPVANLPAGHPLRPAGNAPTGLGVEIVIEVDDVAAAYERAVRSGEAIESQLRTRPWGLRDFRVLAPGGYYVRVTSR